jgi:hypothetical protein
MRGFYRKPGALEHAGVGSMNYIPGMLAAIVGGMNDGALEHFNDPDRVDKNFTARPIPRTYFHPHY